MAAYIGYYRVSTQKQGRSGLGLAAQKTAVRNYVEQQGGTLAGEFVEVESGKRDDRPELAKALAACRVKRAIFVVAKLDRLARRALTILRLVEESRVEIIALDHPQLNKLTLTIYAAIAEHEADLISTRTKSALQQRKAKGVQLGGHIERISPEHARKGVRQSVATRQERATKYAKDMALVIGELCAGCESLRAKARCLNEHGYPAPRGGQWTPVQVQRLLGRIEQLSTPVTP